MLLRKMKLGTVRSDKSGGDGRRRGHGKGSRSSRNRVGIHAREAVSASDYMGAIDGEGPAASNEGEGEDEEGPHSDNCSDEVVEADLDSCTGAIEQLANACQAAAAADVFAFDGVIPAGHRSRYRNRIWGKWVMSTLSRVFLFIYLFY